MNVSRYTYLKVRTASGDEQWAAVSLATVPPGATVSVENPVEMQHFQSTTLGRTFERISFGTLGQESATPSAAGHSAIPPAAGHGSIPPAAGDGPAPAARIDHRVPRATGPEARTISEIFAQSTGLKGRPVRVRAIVTKVTRGVLGHTFFHLQDGTGNSAAGDHDLPAMTKASLEPNAEVELEGRVDVDAALGGGLRYPVLLRDAQVLRRH